MIVMFQNSEQKASGFVPIRGNDRFSGHSYKRNMATAAHHDWYLKEWLATLDVKQAQLDRLTGWGKRKTSELVSGKQKYNREVVNEAAFVLHIAPYELLLHPQDAMALRQLSGAAKTYVTVAHDADAAVEVAPGTEKRKKTGTENA